MKIRYLLLLFVALIISSEICLRLKLPNRANLAKITTPSNDKILGYELLPQARIKYNGIPCKINETSIEISRQGFRDSVFDLNKGDKKRVAFIGDSFVFGLGIEARDSVPKQLERILNEKSDIKYEVMNCGVIGYNIEAEIEFMKEKVLKFNPDIVIFLITEDDIYPLIELPKNKFFRFLFKYSYLYQDTFLKTKLILQDKIYSDEKNLQYRINKAVASFKSIKTYLHQGQSVVLVTINLFDWMQPIINICDKEGIYTLDLSPYFHQSCRDIKISNCDGHFNPMGSRMVAEKVNALLKIKILK